MIALDRRLAGASLLVVAALLGAVSGRPFASAITAALLLAATVTGPRIDLGLGLQRVVAIVAAGLGIALGLTGVADASLVSPGLDRVWIAATIALLFAAAPRLVLRAPERGAIATTVLGLLALMCVGETEVGSIYKVAVAAHLTFALLALREGDPGRPPFAAIPRRSVVLAAALALTAAALGLAATRALFPMSDWTAAHIARLGMPTPTSGFSERLWLGSLDGMLQSDEVVMRIEGARPDYLRGAVYDHYELGRWSGPRRGAQDFEASTAAPSGPSAVTVTMAGGALDRYFLPLGARAVVPEGEGVIVERFGTLRLPKGSATGIRFEQGAASQIPIAEPTDEDLRIPADLLPTVARLAAAWTRGSDDPARKIEAIAAHLQADFRYSLEFHQRHREALLDFLNVERRGHCEYFASAMTLLARAVGVPARVVAGYRVAEQSPFGGYWIVREKNAHAWTEVYLPGRGFVAVDATPGGPLQNTPHALGLLGALRDFVAAWLVKADGASGGHLGQLALGTAALSAFAFLLVRSFLRRGKRAKRERRFDPEESPPPGLVRLFDALARAGFERSPSEPLERFAGRLEAAKQEGAAELLRRYAAQRYGGVGELSPLLGELEACAGQLAAYPRSR